MKVVLFCNSATAINTLLELQKNQSLAGIVMPEDQHEDNLNTEAYAREHDIPVHRTNKSGLATTTVSFVQAQGADCLLCLTFPYVFPAPLLEATEWGAWNVHYSQLPKYRGNDPIFWQLCRQERVVGVTIHKMLAEVDAGDILIKESFGVYPGENYGLLRTRLGVFTSSLVKDKFLSTVNQAATLAKPQVSTDAEWLGRPTPADLTIRWDKMEADQIEALVNAANPTYGGAIAYFRQAPIRILEVSPADVKNTAVLSPGSIVYADGNQGLFVGCLNQRFLRINILSTPEAILTGMKLAALGIKPGEKFT